MVQKHIRLCGLLLMLAAVFAVSQPALADSVVEPFFSPCHRSDAG